MGIDIAGQLGLSAINWSGILANTLYWVGYIVVGIFIIGFFIALSMILSYNIKVTVLPLCGSGKEGVYSVGKEKKNRFKKIRGGTSWKALFPLFNRKEIEPFDDDSIYPGKKTYAFELNGELIPGRVNISNEGGKIKGDLSPVPYYVRNWQSLQHKKNNLEYAEHDWWTDNKVMVVTLVAVALCCAMAVVTVYLSYKFAAGGGEKISALTEAIKNFGVSSGVGPS